jgi:hypothetical protein
MTALWKSLTKKRELSKSWQKRILIFRATLSISIAISLSLLGLAAVLKEGIFYFRSALRPFLISVSGCVP